MSNIKEFRYQNIFNTVAELSDFKYRRKCIQRYITRYNNKTNIFILYQSFNTFKKSLDIIKKYLEKYPILNEKDDYISLLTEGNKILIEISQNKQFQDYREDSKTKEYTYLEILGNEKTVLKVKAFLVKIQKFVLEYEKELLETNKPVYRRRNRIEYLEEAYNYILLAIKKYPLLKQKKHYLCSLERAGEILEEIKKIHKLQDPSLLPEIIYSASGSGYFANLSLSDLIHIESDIKEYQRCQTFITKNTKEYYGGSSYNEEAIPRFESFYNKSIELIEKHHLLKKHTFFIDSIKEFKEIIDNFVLNPANRQPPKIYNAKVKTPQEIHNAKVKQFLKEEKTQAFKNIIKSNGIETIDYNIKIMNDKLNFINLSSNIYNKKFKFNNYETPKYEDDPIAVNISINTRTKVLNPSDLEYLRDIKALYKL